MSSGAPSETLKDEEYETIQFISAFIGRCALFTVSALWDVFSIRAGCLYRVFGYLAPRWRRSTIVAYSLYILLSMPGTQRMIKVTTLAVRGYSPRKKAFFELLWSGSAIVVWSSVTWAVYKFMPTLSVASVPLLAAKTISARIDVFIFAIVSLWVLTALYPNIWRSLPAALIRGYTWSFEALCRSRFFPILVRLCHVYDGFLISGLQRWLRRNGDALRNQHTPEGTASGLEEHKYKTLRHGQFRLLRITRSYVIAPFECELMSFDLDASDRPEYTAVSYAWGPNSEIRPRNLRIKDRTSEEKHIEDLPIDHEHDEKVEDTCIKYKQLAVTESAYQVVCGLAPASGELYLWCDFICINQNDLTERASQVKMMGDIYTQAAKVTVCLNTAEVVDYDDSDAAAYHLYKTNRSLKQPKPDIGQLSAKFDKTTFHGRESPGWHAIIQVFRRQYWTRAWVVQEIVLAKKLVVVYGDNELQWDDLTEFAEAFDDVENDGNLDIMEALAGGASIPIAKITMLLLISRIRKDYQQSRGLSLRELISYGPQFSATDPRDNVFAFQGLSSDAVPASMQPDYKISPVNLYINITREIFTGDRSLWFLNYAGCGFGDRSLESRFVSIQDDELPSWVPNWGDSLKKSRLPTMKILKNHDALQPHIDDAGTALSVHSSIFDTIVKVCDLPVPPTTNAEMNLEAASVDGLLNMTAAIPTLAEQIEADMPPSYPTGLSRDEALWRVLSGNQTNDPMEIRRNIKSLSIYFKQNELTNRALSLIGDNSNDTTMDKPKDNDLEEQLVRLIAKLDDFGGSQEKRSRIPPDYEQIPKSGLSASQKEVMFYISTRFHFALSRHCAGRKLAFTQQGHFVLVPPLTAPGDEVHFIALSDTPFVLRVLSNQESLNSPYRLLGDCYVYGVEFEEVAQASGINEVTLI